MLLAQHTDATNAIRTTSGDANPAYDTAMTSPPTAAPAGATLLAPNAITRADPTTPRASPQDSSPLASMRAPSLPRGAPTRYGMLTIHRVESPLLGEAGRTPSRPGPRRHGRRNFSFPLEMSCASPTQGEGHTCSGAEIPADDGAISVAAGPAGRGR